MKKILIALLLLMPFQTGAVVKHATVFNPIDGSRKIVEVGSPDAFNDGYLLEVAQVKTIPEGMLGFSVVTDYSKNISTSINATQTTIPVTSMTTKDEHTLTMADFGSKVFLVIEAGRRKEEIVMCEGISGTSWTSCTRGLAFYGTSTASVTANQMTHNPGSSIMISNTHYVYDENVDKDSNETITGIKTFTSSPIVPSPSEGDQAANKTYVDGIAIQGGATSTETVMGLVELGTQTEMVETTFDAKRPTVISTKYSTSSPDIAGNYAVISEDDGKINQRWLDLTEDFEFSGDTTLASTTITGTTTLNNTLVTQDIFSNDYILNGATKVMTAGEDITGGTLPTPVFIEDGNYEDESKFVGNSGVNIDRRIYGPRYLGGNFVTDSVTNRITSLQTFFSKVGSPTGNLVLSIYLADAEQKPTGSPLVTKSLEASSLSNSVTFYLATTTVAVSTRYVFVISLPSGDSSNYFKWGVANTGGSGHLYSTDSGSTWEVDTDGDVSYGIYGFTAGTTGNIYISDANGLNKNTYDGFAITNAISGNDVNIQFNNIVSGFTDLDIQDIYYVQNTAGTIGTAVGDTSLQVGKAISTTELLMMY